MKKYESMLTAKLKAACKNGLADVIKYKTEATQVSQVPTLQLDSLAEALLLYVT